MSGKWGESEMSRTHNIDDLNPNLLEFFKQHNVRLLDKWILIHWYDDHRLSVPHTDGDRLTNDLIKKRRCGINWNFTPGTWVEFYDDKSAVPYIRSEDIGNTFWKNVDKIIDKWDTAGPVIFNPQIIHAVRGTQEHGRRISCTLRFYETFESITEKLQNFIHR
jgi:hypothetical protein